MTISPTLTFCTSLALSAALSAQTFDFAAAAAYSDVRNGHALVAMHRGAIVFEDYPNGGSPTQLHRLASATKSVTGVLLAIAVDDGLVGFDEPLANILTEWQGLPTKGVVTYRQLIGLRGGIFGGQIGNVPSYSDAVANAVVIGPPDTVFNYGPVPFQIFGEALRRKLAAVQPVETVADYLLRRLLTPLGVPATQWTGFGIGEPGLPSGAYLLASEFVKFGEMVRNRGFYNGQQIVSAGSLAACLAPGPVNDEYGVGWWLPGTGTVLPSDLAMAKGAGKQRLYVLPSQELVLVRYGESPSWSDVGFLAALMPSSFLPYGSGCGGSAGVPNLTGDPLAPPAYGQSAGLNLDSLPSNALGQFFLGFSKDFHLGLPLPFALDMVGMPGCQVFASLDISQAFQATGGGTAATLLPIPLDNALPSNSVYLQALVFDAAANAAGLTLSNALELRIGIR